MGLHNPLSRLCLNIPTACFFIKTLSNLSGYIIYFNHCSTSLLFNNSYNTCCTLHTYNHYLQCLINFHSLPPYMLPFEKDFNAYCSFVIHSVIRIAVFVNTFLKFFYFILYFIFSYAILNLAKHAAYNRVIV